MEWGRVRDECIGDDECMRYEYTRYESMQLREHACYERMQLRVISAVHRIISVLASMLFLGRHERGLFLFRAYFRKV